LIVSVVLGGILAAAGVLFMYALVVDRLTAGAPWSRGAYLIGIVLAAVSALAVPAWTFDW
jgi:hypothetical protein